ncbi:MAG: RHS repeat-associated core domain-containing protein [Candidatus Melainabacteria bacterium]|nr:RHS repeat-associated core domain-containing protein [Candidatus Melainabacteria bacterium]
MTNTSKDTVGASSTNNGSLALAPQPPIPPQVPVTPPAKPLPLPKTGPSSKHPVTARPPGWQFQRGKQTTPADARKIIDGRVHDQSKIYKPKRKLGFASNTVQGPASIVELARALKNDPQLIYEFVYNNIEWEPGFGVQKGGLGCLLDGMGNSFDQSMLLVELLREAGFTADYVLGTIQLTEAELMAWFGTNDIWGSASYCGNENIPYQSPTWNGTGWDMILSHMWVNVVISATTYVMDPSYKTYNRTAAVSSLGTILGYNAGTFLSNAQSGATVTTDYVQDMNTANIHGDLTTMTSNLTSWIATNQPDATVEDILGGQAIVPVSLPITFPTSLPYQAPGDTPTVWTTDIPLAYKTTLQIQFPDNGSGWCIDETFTSDQLAGKRLTLFFNGSLQPVLALDGTVVATGIAQGSGTWNSVLLTVTHNAYPVTWYDQQWWQSYIWAGQYYLIGNAWGNLGREQALLHSKELSKNKAAGGASTSEPVMGEQLAVVWYNWAAQASRVSDLVNRMTNCHSMLNHQVGIVSFNSGGAGAFALDIGGVSGSSTNLDNDVTQTPINDTVTAMHGVALEAAVMAQTTGLTPGVSTTTVIDAANTNGNKIYKGTGSNWNTGSNIEADLVTAGYNSTDMANIYNWYLQWGWDVMLADDPAITLGSWQGWGDFLYPGLSGAFGLINGTYKGGGAQPGGAIAASPNPAEKENPPYQPTKGDPITMVTGDFIYSSNDLALGSGEYPYQLTFQRFYNSASQYSNGVLGRGWSHGFDLSASVNSDGFLAMGDQFAAQGAASIAELFVDVDLLSDTARPVEKLVTVSLATAWWIDRLVNNTVLVAMPYDTSVYVAQPDGTFTAPARNPSTLTLSSGAYTVTNPQGIAFNYDTNGKIDTIDYPNGVTLTFTYASGLLSTVTNGMGRTLTLNYTSGKLTSVTDGTGRTVSYTIDGSSNLTTFTDANGEDTTYSYDNPGRMTEYFKPANPATAFATNVYDSLSRIQSQDNGRGQTWEFFFAGSRTEMVDPLSNSEVSYFNRLGGVTRFIDPLGNETACEFDGLNRLVEKTFPEGNKVQWTYDLNNNVLTQTSVAKSGSGLSDIVETFTYDSTWAKMETSEDGNGNTTTYTYDGTYGNLLTIERPVIASVTPTVTMTWNTRGQMLTREDETGVVTKFVYDATYEKMTSVIVDYNVSGHLNLTTSFGHDSVGNVTGVTDPNGNQSTMVYDDLRQVTQVTSPSPFSYVTNFTYDENGNMLTMERQTGGSPAWQINTWTYSVTDKKLTSVDPASNATTWTYDGKDRLETMTDAESRLWQYDYDAMDRVNQVIDPTSTVSDTRTFTGNGRLESIEDARSNVTQYTYDGFDRLDETIYADSTFEQNSSYDDNGNVLTYLTRSGDSIVNTYDVLNRLATKSPTSQPVITYTYDLANRLTQVSKPVVSGDPSSGALVFSFDTAGRFYQEQYPDSKTVTHVLDDNGNRTQTTWPDSYYVTRVFDEMNRLTDIKLNGSGTSAVTFTYNDLSQRTQMAYSNGTTVDYTPQLNEDVTTITHSFVGSSVVFTYGFNDVHEPNSVHVSDDTYMYHPAAASTTYATADGVNKYPTVGGTSYSYDGNKNLTGDGVWTYGYDTENHMLTAAKTGVSASFVYDPKERQSQKTVGSVKSRYIYSEWQRIADYDGTAGTLQNRYVYGTSMDEPLIQVSSAGVLTFLHADKVGSIIATSNNSGAVSNKNLYSPFGEIVTLGGTTFGFTGQRYDSELGLSYYKRRMYSPKLGRFLQPDPIGYASRDLNLYAYVGNSPLTFTDPMGTMSKIVAFIIALLILIYFILVILPIIQKWFSENPRFFQQPKPNPNPNNLPPARTWANLEYIAGSAPGAITQQGYGVQAYDNTDPKYPKAIVNSGGNPIGTPGEYWERDSDSNTLHRVYWDGSDPDKKTFR